MISKELFVRAINTVIEQQEHSDKLCEALELCATGCYCDAFIYSDYETLVFDMLLEGLELSPVDDIFGYWYYECSKGKDPFEYNGKDYLLDTPEKFYDFIMEEYKKE